MFRERRIMIEMGGFRFVHVDDHEEFLTETYRLRYEIYCHEAEFLDDEEYAEGIETDLYDKHSLHFAALDKQDKVVGTLRLILASEHPFPLEAHCPNYDKSKIHFPQRELAEISRLAVSKSFRRRKNDGLYGMTSYHSTDENRIPDKALRKRKRPVVIFGLYKMMYLESKRRGITHWYAAMEQKLNETLRKFSFYFEAIGPEEDYYGPVTPFLADIAHVEAMLHKEKPLVMHIMAWGLESKYMPKLGIAFPLKNYVTMKAVGLSGKI